MNKYYHPKFYLVRELIGILYDLPGCGSGGCCHIVTDDDNIYDDDLDFVIEYCDSPDNVDEIEKELAKTICIILKQMTFQQRAVLFELIEKDIDKYDLLSENCVSYLGENEKELEGICKEYDYSDLIYPNEEPTDESNHKENEFIESDEDTQDIIYEYLVYYFGTTATCNSTNGTIIINIDYKINSNGTLAKLTNQIKSYIEENNNVNFANFYVGAFSLLNEIKKDEE